MKLRNSFILALFSALLSQGAAEAVDGITLSYDNLKVEVIDSDAKEFFVSHTMDLKGRLFVGTREALFVYERKADGGFAPRQELFRFPAHTWLYDLEVVADDLLVLTNTALYRIPGAVTKRQGLVPEKLIWGMPQGHYHQGLHAIEFGPDGDLFIAMGDPQPHLHWDRQRPDHLWHWTFLIGPDNKPFAYTGVGAVFRYRLKDHSFSVYAGGMRNACGASFDSNWNLFVNDNDQEGSFHSPGRLCYVPPQSWHGWVRGWAARQNVKRRDVLPVVDLQLDVPVGQCWYDDSVLGPALKNSVLVANWGNRTVSQHVTRQRGGGFYGAAQAFLVGEGERRPVSVGPTNDGRLIVAVCYMKGNEGSPVRKTDLLLISPKVGKFPLVDFSRQNRLDLLKKPWQLRYKAHQEILRSGGDALVSAAARFLKARPSDPDFSSLIYLAAAHGDARSTRKITELAAASGPARTLALRVMADYPDRFAPLDAAPVLRDTKDPAVLLALLDYLHTTPPTIPVSDAVAELAAHADAYVRQSAARLLARRGTDDQLKKLSTGNVSQRLAAVMAAGCRIWEDLETCQHLPPGSAPARAGMLKYQHPDGPVDVKALGKPTGIFMSSQWWAVAENRKRHQLDFQLLQTALSDENAGVHVPAAISLFFLGDSRVDQKAQEILNREGIELAAKSKATTNAAAEKQALRALKFATLPKNEVVPEQFLGIDWKKEWKKGDPKTGKALFTQRGCVACHRSPDDGKGGSVGPTLVDVGKRFSPTYLAESVLSPNKSASPNFYPTTLLMQDGKVHTGFVEANGDKVKLRVVTGQILELDAKAIRRRETSHQSMMPAGLAKSPRELRDLIAFLMDRPLGASVGPEKAATQQPAGSARKPRLDTTFFNGKDLQGWSTSQAKYWSVKEGAIVGDSAVRVPKNEFLWSGIEVKDFLLVVDVKLTPDNCNAGIQFRSKKANAAGQAHGYQADVGAGVWGKLYHEHGRGKLDWNNRAAKAVKRGEWNHYEILAVGHRIWTAINGTLCVAMEDPKGELAGKIAFQVHSGPPQNVRYRVRKLVHDPELKLEKQTKKQLLDALPKMNNTAAGSPPPKPGWTPQVIAWRAKLDANDPGMKGKWFSTTLDDAQWKTMNLPRHYETAGLPNHDGTVWFRRVIELPAARAGRPLTLELGPIDDMDMTWFNGKQVGGIERPGFWAAPRRYAIKGELVKGGRNVIAVRVIDHGAPGGFAGKAAQMRISGRRFKPRSIAGDWKFRPGVTLKSLGLGGLTNPTPAPPPPPPAPLVRPLDRPPVPLPPFPDGFSLEGGESLVILGGSNAADLARFGYFETLLAASYPSSPVHIRNLAWPADTVYRQQRPRNFFSSVNPNYGERDGREPLAVDIAFLWLGQSEVVDGTGNLDSFEAAYRDKLGLLQAYTGRVVLVTPVPCEDPLGLGLDTEKRNRALASVATVIRQLGKEKELPVIDLFSRMKGRQVTRDGLLLSRRGHLLAAQEIVRALRRGKPGGILAGETRPDGKLQSQPAEELRQAVLEKNRLWQQYWRPTNWSFLYGNRQTQPSSRDHRNRKIRWFPGELQGLLPLLEKADLKIHAAAKEAGAPSRS